MLTFYAGLMMGGALFAAPGAFDVGMCTHFSQGKGIVEQNIASLREAGITSIRDEVAWRAVEQERGVLTMPERFDHYVRYAAQQDVDVLLILDYSNPFYDDGDRPCSDEAIEGFSRYSEFVVRHFGQDVRLYEVWNEWDIPIGLPEQHEKRDGEPNRGSPEDYFNLLKAVYPRIKAVDPGITVMGGCPTPGAVRNGWLERIVELGALDYCDAISIHTYNYGASGLNRTPEAWSRWMLEVQAMLRRHNDGEDPILYVTEMGWPTHMGDRGTGPELSGSYLARLYLLARLHPAFRGIWWYDFQDDGWNAAYNESNFGIVRPDLTPKPAWYVMDSLSSLVRDGDYVGRVPTEDEPLWILRFRHAGEDVWAIWSGDDQERQVVLQTADPQVPLVVQQLGYVPTERSWGHREWTESRDYAYHPERLSLVIGHRPWLLRGDLSHVSVEPIRPRSRTK